MKKVGQFSTKTTLDGLNHRTTAYKRKAEIMKGKHQLAIDMVKRAVKSGIYADYLLVAPQGYFFQGIVGILNLSF